MLAQESKLIEPCLHALRICRDGHAEFEPSAQNPPFSGYLRFVHFPLQPVLYVRVLSRCTREMAELVVHQLQTRVPENGMAILFTDYVSPPLAAYFMAHKIAFADAVGNVFLDFPPLYVEVQGRRKKTAKPLPGRSMQSAGARLVFSLLKRPSLAGKPYRDLSLRADVALGAVGTVLKDLEERGFIEGSGRKRILCRQERLLEDWVCAYAERLRPRLVLGRCRPAPGMTVDFLPTTIKAQNLGSDVLLGGELAAAQLCSDCHSDYAVLHTSREQALNLMLRLRLLPDDEGPIELVEQFGQENAWNGWQPDGLLLVDPLLIYAELQRGNKGSEAALQQLRTIYLAPRLGILSTTGNV